jgi:hypothetical protein
MKRKYERSPKYPQLSLPKALQRLRAITVDSKPREAEELSVILGFVGQTGASMAVLSSLRAYGLVNKTKLGMQFSEAAIRMRAMKDTDPDYAELVETLAFNPPIYSDIRRAFGNEFPDLEKLEKFLLDQGFVEKIVPRVIQTYKDTYNFVARVNPSYPTASGGRISLNHDPEPVSNKAKQEFSGMEWVFDFAEEIQICVRFAKPPSASSIRKLRDFLNNNEMFWEDSVAQEDE